jgi:catechol-2,3-dioxygenase
VLGFELTTRLGPAAAFLSAGGYHHHIGLNTWESRGGQPPPRDRRALHVAIRYPDRAALADALRRLVAARVPLEGRRTTASAKRSTCTIPTATGSSSIGIARASSGRTRLMARCA